MNEASLWHEWEGWRAMLCWWNEDGEIEVRAIGLGYFVCLISPDDARSEEDLRALLREHMISEDGAAA